jgi:predicted glycosyltransferase
MKILLLLRHPVDTMICNRLKQGLEEKGHEIIYAVIEKENIIQEILDYQNIDYHYIGHTEQGLTNKLLNLAKIDQSLFKLVKKMQPDIAFSTINSSMGQISKLFKLPIIGMMDTDSAGINIAITFPLYSRVLVPSWYRNSLFGTKVIKYKGYKELIYTHPNYFKPDISVLDELDLSKDDKIIVMRFSSLDATHDFGVRGIDRYRELLLKRIKEFEKDGYVYISKTEKTLGKQFDKYNLNLHPSKYIDLLAFSTLYFGEGSTSASEAGILGTPWIFTLDYYAGNLFEQENRYDLGYKIPDIKKALEKAKELFELKEIKTIWKTKSRELLNENIDVGKFLIWYIDKYPESKDIMLTQPDYQNRFK